MMRSHSPIDMTIPQHISDLTRITLEKAPYSRFFMACEGGGTEPGYFRALKRAGKSVGINPNIKIEIWHKPEKENHTRPDLVFGWALGVLEEKIKQGEFDSSMDYLAVAFDTDGKTSNEVIRRIIGEAQEKNTQIISEVGRDAVYGDCIHLMVTHPAFELFLLLHKEKDVAYEKCTLPDKDMDALDLICKHKDPILANEMHPDNISQRYICGLLSLLFHKNSKSPGSWNPFARKVKIAIENEKSPLINKDISNAVGQLTSNVATTIEQLLMMKN